MRRCGRPGTPAQLGDEAGERLRPPRPPGQARLRPEDVGLRDYGRTRRVAGLRREELARLAGVSIAHYTRLEQGRADSVSDEILDAVGAALRLAGDELTYLHRIARPPLACEGGAAAVPASLRELHRAGWERAAREQVAHLRVLLGRYRGDAGLAGRGAAEPAVPSAP
ncbi:helix-turn-helix domain-containing protein [Nonomuraea angiospora]